jgi:SAM-dependent methyltransferase
MSGFSADWLALREPHDQAARNAKVLEALAAAFADRPSIGIVDLACGTGSTYRALNARLKPRQNWRLVDNDLSLLARAPQPASPRLTVTTVPVDLNRDLEAALDGALDLVTTSALLDLVSDEWLQRLTVEAAARRLPVYAALSYDGRVEMTPADADDAAVIAAVNAHQRTDKGFGPALGPGAAQAAIEGFERVGYSVVHGEADWVFGPRDRDIQLEVLSGWAAAAREIGGVALPGIVAWLTRRRDLVLAGRSSIRVGHRDLFALPRASR